MYREAITSVYDHNSHEGKSMGSIRDWEKQRTEACANKIVEDAVQHLKNSVNHGSSSTRPRFGAQGSGNGVSSSSLLNNLRSNSSTVGIPSNTCPTDILVRLRLLFEPPNASYSTSEVLQRFFDVEDKFAPVFREMLRTVAKLQSGKWTRK